MVTSFRAPESPRLTLLLLSTTVLLIVLGTPPVSAHEHGSTSPSAISTSDLLPLDPLLSLHILLQLVAWGILYPLGMVFGLTRSPWHVPTQTMATLLTAAGFVLGHKHGGREYPLTAHSTVANLIFFLLCAQVSLGVYLKLHMHEETRFRRIAVGCHGFLGKSWPIVSWLQIMLGVLTSLTFCLGEHTGQCLAHLIMGSAFIIYGAIYLLMLRAGAPWLEHTGKSQEHIDSWVLMVWGIVNTFTEHRGGTWSHKDMQHTTMGIVWWASGALSIFLTRNNKRSVFPSLILIFTGYAFFSHAQNMELSSKLHGAFGSTLMLAGLARIIEISFILKDAPADNHNIRSFQHLPPYLLVVSGTMFMTVTEEQLALVNDIGMDHSTYTLLQLTIAAIVYLWTNMLVSAYEHSGKNAANRQQLGVSSSSSSSGSSTTARRSDEYRPLTASTSTLFSDLGMMGSDEFDGDNKDVELERM
ncbi:hypothetical protein DFJ77DRAFT_434581 [Powellomyces hirtus]|nr:hypothetical protein DFJ77DRAFT_434581 [Powellomyces hirtus]